MGVWVISMPRSRIISVYVPSISVQWSSIRANDANSSESSGGHVEERVQRTLLYYEEFGLVPLGYGVPENAGYPPPYSMEDGVKA